MVLQKFAYVYVINITKLQMGDINDNNNSRAKSFMYIQGTSLMENYIQFHNGMYISDT